MAFFKSKATPTPEPITLPAGSNEELFNRVTVEGDVSGRKVHIPSTHSGLLLVNGEIGQLLHAGENIIDAAKIHPGAKVDVLFLSHTVRIPCLFGTSSPIVLRDPKTDLVVHAGVRGTFDVNIENAHQAYLQLIGIVDNFDITALKERLRILMNARIGSVVANITYEEKISYDMYDFSKERIEEGILDKLSYEFSHNYGIKLFSLIVENIFMPEADKKLVEDELARRKLAEEPTGKKIFCTKCGAEMHEGDIFCSKCGERTTQFGDPCPACGTINSPGSAFCKGCGRKLK